MRINGLLCWDQNTIKDHIKDFYKKLFSENRENSPNYGIIKDVIPDLVTAEDNCLLVVTPPNEEIRKEIFSLDPNSALGPDGFNGSFFQHCWDIIGSDICEAIKEFFRTGKILENLNNNFLVHIPKTEGASSIVKFRPIVLSNFLFKIINKILAESLSGIAARIVLPNQYGFIRGRRIQECIFVAYKVVNQLEKKNSGRNMIIKLDIRKAFDSMSWDFILVVLESFGFSEKFRGWILEIFKSARISILYNGSQFGFFDAPGV